jgi:hypothetical protein
LRRIPILLLALFAAAPAFAQSTLLQGGPWAPGHAPMYVGQGSGQAVVQDSGPAGGGNAGIGLSELGITARGTGSPPYVGQGTGPFNTNSCNFDAPINNPTGYHFLCSSPNATQAGQTGGLITYGAGGIATPLPLTLCANGTCYTPGGGIAGLTNGVTTIAGSGRQAGGIFYDNAGVLGEYPVSVVTPVNVMLAGAKCDWNGTTGTDDHDAIQTALNTYKAVLIPQNCYVGSTLTFGNLSFAMITGINSITYSSNINTGSSVLVYGGATNTPVISVVAAVPGLVIKNLGVTRVGTAIAGGTGILFNGFNDNPVLDNIEVEKQFVGVSLSSTGYGKFQNSYVHNNVSDGVVMQNPTVANQYQWYLDTVISSNNGGWNYHVIAPATAAINSQVTMGTWTNTFSFAGGSGGASFNGNSTVSVQGVRMFGGFYGSDAGVELYFDTYNTSSGPHQINNIFAEINTSGPCLQFTGNNSGEITMSGATIIACNTNGITNTANLSVVGGIIASSGGYGIVNGGTANVTATVFSGNASGIYSNSGVYVGRSNNPTGANTALPVSEGGTNATTVPGARVNLAIDQRSTFSNANAVATNATYLLAQIGSMSAARTVTLPAASTMNPGQRMLIDDESGTVTSSNTVSIAPNGSDTINTSNTTQVAFNAAFGYVELETDGVSKWTAVRVSLGSPLVIGGILPVANGGTGVSLAATGGASQVLKQASSGANVTVGQLSCSDLSNAGTGCSGSTSSGGTVTSVATTGPITGGTFTTSGTIGCATCVTTAGGQSIAGTTTLGTLAATTINAFTAGGAIAMGGNNITGGGTAAFTSLTSAAHTITSASANALAVGLNGVTNPAFNVDASTASSATGLNVKSAAAAGGLALSVISSGAAENLTINAKGSGTINIGNTSTGQTVIGNSTSIYNTGLITTVSLALNGCTIGSNILCVNGLLSASSHILATSTAPTISSCGTGSPTASGGDTFGTVVAGGGVLASCVVNFGTTWGAAPRCVVSSGTAIASLTVTTSTTQLTIGGTSLTGDTINWICGSTASLDLKLIPANDNANASEFERTG